MGENSLIHRLEAELFKKLRLVGQGKHPFHAEPSRFFETGSYEFQTDALLPDLLLDDQRANLGEVFPADVQSADAHDFPVPDINEEVPEMIVEIAQGPGKYFSSGRIGFDQLLDFLHVLQLGFPNHLDLPLPPPSPAGSNASGVFRRFEPTWSR